MVNKNDLIEMNNLTFRVLHISVDRALIINCCQRKMPEWISVEILNECPVSDKVLMYRAIEELSPNERKKALERFAMISRAVAVIDDEKGRSNMITLAAEQFKVSKQSVRSFLWSYLVYQNIGALAPKSRTEKPLTDEQKNFRWALNKYFYTRNQNSLPTAYTMMLKEKYCTPLGELMPDHPTFAQFRYFYRQTRKLENYHISRDGIKKYQRNKRPLLGEDGVQSFAPTIGTAMLDGTICDIYLVDNTGQLIGRPVLVAAVDANTSLCLGYSLLWEGGTYSLQSMMLNIISDKVALCEKLGFSIQPGQWPCNQLPLTMVTDGGSEYKGKTFEQIAELGVTLINLPGFRPELKGPVEKFFDLIQSSYKMMLKGKGVILSDFQERGGHDYRKDAVLTLSDFEKIIVRCIVYYNSERVVENYPYTPEMIAAGIQPHAADIWNFKAKSESDNLITVSSKELILTLLPRTNGRFDRYGLHVNKLRYAADGYKEQFLSGGNALVAYNPDDCSKVWVKESDGRFVEFTLIETRYSGKNISEAASLQKSQVQLSKSKSITEANLQAQIDLMNFIETVANGSQQNTDININGARKARTEARRKTHKDLGGIINE